MLTVLHSSITFGNWFKIAKSVMPKYAVHELTKAYRSRNEHLQVIWDKVRNCEDDILEYLTKYEYTTRLNESILSRECNCLKIIIGCIINFHFQVFNCWMCIS